MWLPSGELLHVLDNEASIQTRYRANLNNGTSARVLIAASGCQSPGQALAGGRRHGIQPSCGSETCSTHLAKAIYTNLCCNLLVMCKLV